MNVATLNQGGLGLPDRDYYLVERLSGKKQAYQDFLEKLFSLVQWPAPTASAAKVVGFETEIARLSWTKEDLRNPEKVYNKMRVQDVIDKAPGFSWEAFFEAAGPIPANTTVIVGSWGGSKSADQQDGIVGIAELVGRTDVDTLLTWSAAHILTGASSYLTQAFVDARLEYAKVSTGQQVLLPRWQRGVAVASTSLPDAVGQLYVARYFPDSSKRAIDELTHELK